MRRQLARPAPTESRRLSETSKAVVFSAMLLTLALAAALVIRALDPPQLVAYIIWGSTPLVAVLIMMFLITDDGRTRAGRSVSGCIGWEYASGGSRSWEPS